MTNLTNLVTHITLDMCGDTRKFLVSAKQGDKATRYIAAKLLNNGEEYTIPEDAKAVVNMEKPDGKHVYNTCTYQNSEVLVELTNQMLAAAGTAYCDIEIRTEDDSQIITSVSFTIEIEKAIKNEKAILSSNEFTELNRRFKDIKDTEEMIKIAELERVSAENERASAESERDIAENIRQEQETARQENTEQALQDVQDVIEAAQKATEECNDSILVIDEINATVDSSTGTPSVTVNTEGENSNKKFNFEFKNLKGETGQRGSKWYTGTAITGTNTTSTVFTGSGITDAVINDYYLNTSTGCVYRCTESGIAAVAKWVYEGSLNNSTGTADKANKDGNGNVISETYLPMRAGSKRLDFKTTDAEYEYNVSIDSEGIIINELEDGVYTSMAQYTSYGTFIEKKEIYRMRLMGPAPSYVEYAFEGGASKNFHARANSGSCDLGTSNDKWKQLYAANGTIQTSDRNEKNTVNELSVEQAKSLILGLKPSTYKMNSGTSGRTHWGMISQDIEELLEELGWDSTDFAGFIKSPKIRVITEDENGNPLKELIEEVIEGKYNYSLRYDEFVAPTIRVVQDHEGKLVIIEDTVQKHAEEIETLKETVQAQNETIQSLLARLEAVEQHLNLA